MEGSSGTLQTVTGVSPTAPAVSSPAPSDATWAYVHAAKADRTLRAYRTDWADFESWCAEQGVAALPAAPATVADYCTFLVEEKARSVATVQRRLSSISQAHQAAGFETTPTSSLLVRSALRGIKRTFGSAPRSKDAIRTEDLRRIVKVIDLTTVQGIRDRALLLVGFAGAFRRSELVALDVSDLDRSQRTGIVVTVRRSKTDQEGEGRIVGIPKGIQPETCPVSALRAWLKVGKIKDGPIFRSIDRHGNVDGRLSAQSVALIVKRAAESAGIDATKVGGHSLRSGHATSAAEAGASERAIMRTTGHRSEKMVRRYIRQGTVWSDNSATSLGL